MMLYKKILNIELYEGRNCIANKELLIELEP